MTSIKPNTQITHSMALCSVTQKANKFASCFIYLFIYFEMKCSCVGNPISSAYFPIYLSLNFLLSLFIYSCESILYLYKCFSTESYDFFFFYETNKPAEITIILKINLSLNTTLCLWYTCHRLNHLTQNSNHIISECVYMCVCCMWIEWGEETSCHCPASYFPRLQVSLVYSY